MARPRKSDRRTEQVNFKITKANNDLLDAVAYLEDRTSADVARRVLEDHLAEWAKDPDIIRMVKRRAAGRAEKST